MSVRRRVDLPLTPTPEVVVLSVTCRRARDLPDMHHVVTLQVDTGLCEVRQGGVGARPTLSVVPGPHTRQTKPLDVKVSSLLYMSESSPVSLVLGTKETTSSDKVQTSLEIKLELSHHVFPLVSFERPRLSRSFVVCTWTSSIDIA